MDPQLKQKIDAVKETGLPVFSAKIGNATYIYRGMNRREFRELQGVLAKMAEDTRAKFAADEIKMNSELSLLKEKGEEKVVLKCLLSPELKSELDMDGVPAGAITKIADLVMKASGFDDSEPEQPEQL